MTGTPGYLELRDITVAFSRWGQKVVALDRVSLTVPEGQWLILVGPNGSGKSTLIRAVSGRVQPDKGQVLVNGKSVAGMSPAELANNVFHVHQDPLLGTAPILTVFENLAVADHQARLDREPKRLLAKKYCEMLRPLGLGERLKQPVRTLSGGERQLLALLIARLRPSSIVLLDEPLAALDPFKAEVCMREISDLSRRGKTIIQVTHNQEHAALLGDRTVALQGGRVVYDEGKDSRTTDSLSDRWYAGRSGGLS
jgi:putative tryptophan/tyrosine transport system ATP-binding protein